MALTWYQDKLYQNTCSIFRLTREISPSTGQWSDGDIELVAADVRCHYDYTQNDDDPQPGLGRVKRRSALTEDSIHFDVAEDVRSQDWTFDTTPGSPTAGTVHRLESAPRRLPSLGGRTPNAAVFQAMEDEEMAETLRGLGLIP